MNAKKAVQDLRDAVKANGPFLGAFAGRPCDAFGHADPQLAAATAAVGLVTDFKFWV